MNPMSYVTVIEKTRTGYSAYVPDLPGCVATGRTRGRVEKLIAEAIVFHIEGMRESGEAVPKSTTISHVVNFQPA